MKKFLLLFALIVCPASIPAAAPVGALLTSEITEFDIGDGLVNGEKVIYAYNADSTAAADTSFDWSVETGWTAATIREYEYNTNRQATLVRYQYCQGATILTASTMQMEYDGTHAIPFRVTTTQSLTGTRKYRQTVTFDSLNRIAEQVFDDSTPAHVWRNTRRYLYEYDSATAALSSESDFTWDTTRGFWAADFWNYHWLNASGNDTLVLHSVWDTADGGMWNNQNLDSMSYTASGEVAETYLYSWRTDLMQWEPVEKRVNTYRWDTFPDSMRLYNWEGSDWLENFRTLNTYDANRNLDSVRSMGFDGVAWAVTERTTYYYDNGNVARERFLPASASLSLSVAPNPFSVAAAIRFSLPASGAVDLNVYDASGRLVRTLINHAVMPAGAHAFRWNGKASGCGDIPPGAYFLRVHAGGRVMTAPLIKVR